MEQRRGALYLEAARGGAADCERAGGPLWRARLDAGAPLLPQAQEALRRMRGRCEWLCLAAEGWMAALALSLAAQLPVDRVALVDGRVFDPGGAPPSRELARLARFARRNLALVAAEVLLIDATEREIGGYMRVLPLRRLCALELCAAGGAAARCAELFCAPWERACENNLLIPGNRV